MDQIESAGVAHKKWYEIVPSWVSAISAFTAMVVGIWVLFFSPASKALVDYLQSEITSRNNRIAILESRERELGVSIVRSETELKSLGQQRDTLKKQIAESEIERTELLSRVAKIKSDLEFARVREKIGTHMAGVLVDLLSIKVADEAFSQNGIRPRREHVWPSYLKFIRDSVDKLPETDKDVGQELFQNFVNQCGRLREVFIDLPYIKSPKLESSADDYNRQEKVVTAKLDAVQKKILSAEADIRKCFGAVVKK